MIGISPRQVLSTAITISIAKRERGIRVVRGDAAVELRDAP
jgi:hypothetical protein